MANSKLLIDLINIESTAMIRKQLNRSTNGLLNDVMLAFSQCQPPFSNNVLDLVDSLDKLIPGVKDMYDLNYQF